MLRSSEVFDDDWDTPRGWVVDFGLAEIFRVERTFAAATLVVRVLVVFPTFDVVLLLLTMVVESCSVTLRAGKSVGKSYGEF